MVVVDRVAEDVEVLVIGVERRELGRRDEADAVHARRGQRLVDAVDGVVVGQREQLDPVRGRARDDVSRRERPVADRGMRLQVELGPAHAASGGPSSSGSTIRSACGTSVSASSRGSRARAASRRRRSGAAVLPITLRSASLSAGHSAAQRVERLGGTIEQVAGSRVRALVEGLLGGREVEADVREALEVRVHSRAERSAAARRQSLSVSAAAPMKPSATRIVISPSPRLVRETSSAPTASTLQTPAAIRQSSPMTKSARKRPTARIMAASSAARRRPPRTRARARAAAG